MQSASATLVRETALNRFASLCVLAAALAGCATVPSGPGQIPFDVACVQGNGPDSYRRAWSGVAVRILEIDGVATVGPEPYCRAPGLHRLGVRAVGGQQSVQQYVDLDLRGGRLLALRARLSGISFLFEAVDVTDPVERQVARFGVLGDYRGEANAADVYYAPSYGSGYPRHRPPHAWTPGSPDWGASGYRRYREHRPWSGSPPAAPEQPGSAPQALPSSLPPRPWSAERTRSEPESPPWTRPVYRPPFAPQTSPSYRPAERTRSEPESPSWTRPVYRPPSASQTSPSSTPRPKPAEPADREERKTEQAPAAEPPRPFAPPAQQAPVPVPAVPSRPLAPPMPSAEGNQG